RAVLAAAMEHANLPSLVPVLYQLTGDRRYLADPYRPTRSRGMEDNDQGGFSPELQAESRAADGDPVSPPASGRRPGPPRPPGYWPGRAAAPPPSPPRPATRCWS